MARSISGSIEPLGPDGASLRSRSVALHVSRRRDGNSDQSVRWAILVEIDVEEIAHRFIDREGRQGDTAPGTARSASDLTKMSIRGPHC